MEDDIPDHIPYFLYFQPKFPIIFPMGISPWLQGGAPPVISWFISPSNYSYKYHKP